jgi:hypothetical protein
MSSYLNTPPRVRNEIILITSASDVMFSDMADIPALLLIKQIPQNLAIQHAREN